jgi:hypothetical protein
MTRNSIPPLSSVQGLVLAGLPVVFPAPSANPPESSAARALRTFSSKWLQDLISSHTQTVTTPIVVSNAVIDGPLDFSYVSFDYAVEFAACEFINGEVDFSFSTFARSAKFTACRFSFSPIGTEYPVSFRAIHAKADLSIARSNFWQGVDFSGIHVDETLDASGAHFGKATFQCMEVAKGADFSVDRDGNRLMTMHVLRYRFL